MVIIFFCLGLILGSFINALVWRLSMQEERSSRKTREKTTTDEALSITKGRSMCPHCRHTLAWKDLIPVCSWLILRGRCRYCHKSISVQYPAVELLTATLFSVVFLVYSQVGWDMVRLMYSLVFVVFFVALALYDIKWFILPNKLVLPLTVVAASQVIVLAVMQRSFAIALQAVLAAAVIFGLFWCIYKVSDEKWIGGGDVNLAVSLGLIAGTPLRSLVVIFLASLFGTVVSIPLIMKGRKGLTAHVPFGPYLLAGCFTVMLFGSTIISWYQRTFL